MHESSLGKVASQTKQTSQKVVDSLKLIQQFAQQKVGALNEFASKAGMNGIETSKLDALEQKLNLNEQAQGWLQERTQTLSGLGKGGQYANALKGISKQSYYYKQKLSSYKQLAEDPSILEEKVLSYLQGMKGFDEAMAKPSLQNGSSSDMQKATSVEDLEKMGYQTKRQVKAQMTQQLGLKKPEQVERLQTKFAEAQKQYADAKQTVTASKDAIQKLGFKPNPMRGLPMRMRIEKSLNWQVLRAVQGLPARLELNAQAGFKHTPYLTYSVVLGGSLGLGKDWQHIRLSNEGIRLGANADLKMVWGISGQLGYERIYKTYTQTTVKQSEQLTIAPQVLSETRQYRDLAYAGLQKTYKLNSKYNGTMLLAYDFLWKQGNATTPIIWRMGWKKNKN